MALEDLDHDLEYEIELRGVVDLQDDTRDDGWDMDDDIQQLLKDSDEIITASKNQDLPSRKQHAITSKFGIIRLQAWWVGTQFLWLLLTVVVMPSQVRSLVGEEHKGKATGLITALGAVFSLFGSPFMGIISDRAMFRTGRRRPFMFFGCVCLSLALLGMAFSAPHMLPSVPHQPSSTGGRCNVGPAVTSSGAGSASGTGLDTAAGSLVGYAVAYMFVSAAYVVQSVPYTGLMADNTHEDVRGFSSGVMGACSTIGMLLGSVAGFFYPAMGVVKCYLLIIGVLWLTGLIPMATIRDPPRTTPPADKFNCRTITAGYLQPLTNHDFRWVFLTRFLMQQGVSTVTGFLEYSLADKYVLPPGLAPERAVAIALGPMLVMSVIASVAAGWLSDRWGKRRKGIVIGSSIGMALCGLVLAASVSFYAVVGTSAVFGTFYGAFLSVDFAMVIDVLPAETDYAKDLAVWHAAIALPNLLAAPTGGFIRDTFQRVGCGCECGLGYIVLFGVASVYFLLCAVFVSRIKGVR